MSLAAPIFWLFHWIHLPVGTSGAQVCRCAWKWVWMHEHLASSHSCCRKWKTNIGWLSVSEVLTSRHGRKVNFFRRLGFELWWQQSWTSVSKRFTVCVGGDCWQCFLISTWNMQFLFFTRLTSEGFTCRDRLAVIYSAQMALEYSQWRSCMNQRRFYSSHYSDCQKLTCQTWWSRVLFGSFSYFVIHAYVFILQQYIAYKSGFNVESFITGISVKNKTEFRLQSNFTKFLLVSLSFNPLTRTTTTFSERIVYLQDIKISHYCLFNGSKK